MPKKDNHKSDQIKKSDAPLNGALKFFIGGCLAEIYLLAVRRYYVNGDVNQMLAWDSAMRYLIYIGLAVLALGVALAVVWRKSPGWKRTTAWSAAALGLLLSAGNLIIRGVYPSGVSILSVVAPAVMLLGVLWYLYSRDCFYAMTVLGSGLLAVWICRHGAGNEAWRVRLIVGACVYLAVLAAVALLARKAENSKGMVRGFRVLPTDTDATVIFVSCGLAAAATVLSLFSAAIAYYALWALAIVIFILAVFYTVKQL